MKQSSDRQIHTGDIFHIVGDAPAMWLKDYNVRVCCTATVLAAPAPSAKKVYVRLDHIDGDANVCVFINKKFLNTHNRQLKTQQQ